MHPICIYQGAGYDVSLDNCAHFLVKIFGINNVLIAFEIWNWKIKGFT